MSLSINAGWARPADQIHASASFQRIRGGVSQRHVIDVEQHLVLTLPVPDLAAGVARVQQDRAYRRFGPAAPSRCGLRARSYADGDSTPSRVSPSAIA